MATFRIGQRVLLLFMGIALIPLLIAFFLLVRFGQSQFKINAVKQQKLAAEKAASEVDNFLGSKVNVLIFQSQTSAIRKFQMSEASLNLATTIKQDRDLEEISLVDKKGKEMVTVNRDGVIAQRQDFSNNDAFKATTFLAGKEYIGPVTYDTSGKPHVVIAVPLIRFTDQQDLTHLSTADFGQYRTADDIQGVIIASFSIDDLWQSVLSTEIGGGGYAYVVDDKGNLIAHPNSEFLAKHQNLSQVHQVQDFLENKEDTHESMSETGIKVLSSYAPISRAKWAVIVEEPISSIFKPIRDFSIYAGAAFVVLAVIIVVLSLIFRKQLLTPIRNLSAGAHKIGAGDFEYMIPVNSHDELGDLAETFNSMGHDLQALVHDLQIKNVKLANEQDKLTSIIKSVSDGVVAVDTNGNVSSINPPAIKLVPRMPNDVVGRNFNEVFKLSKDSKPFMPDFTKAGTYLYHELVLEQGDHFAYIDMSIAVIPEHSSDLMAIITLHDLTPTRELEMMKLDFVAIAAHELRTPLTVVRGYLNLMNSDAISQLSILNIENLQRALIGADQLNNLINNLLNVSRIERGDYHVVKSKVDISKLSKQIIAQQHVTAKLKDQKLIYNGPSSALFIYADVSSISEVINNLISNAMKYTQSGGTIHVNLEKQARQVRLDVTDNGPGIPDTAQKRLFTKFYRVERTLTSGNRGTGLGLFISKTIIDLHQGIIGLKSRVGQGTTFYFMLPLYNEEVVARETSNSKELLGDHGWISKRSDS